MSQGSRRETLRQQIDENLRRVYQQKIEEGIPDRFQELLQQLKGGDAPPPGVVAALSSGKDRQE